MRRSIVFLLVFLLGFGCLDEPLYQGNRAEQLNDTRAVDLDGDLSPDYILYDFAPANMGASGIAVQRQVSVVMETSGTYTSVDPNLTDVDMLVAQQKLEEFSKSRTQADTSCSKEIGLSNVVCSDISTCSRLCSSSSQKCRRIAAIHEEALAGAMITYVAQNNEIRSLNLDAHRMAQDMRNASREEQDAYLNKLRSIVARVAEINANPLYSNSGLMLCTQSDFGIPYVVEAEGKVGDFEIMNTSYRYRVLLSAMPAQKNTALSNDIAGISLGERVLKNSGIEQERISSIQAFSASEDSQNVIVNWSSSKPNKEGYLFYYEFVSSEPPENMIPYLKTPDLRVRKVNLALLAPTNSILLALNGIIGNYYVAFGAAVGFTLAFFFVLYNIIILAFTMVSEKAAGASFTVGFRKAFGRTDVRWRTDLVLAAIFLAGGLYVSSAFATQPASPPPLLESVDFLLKNDVGVVGIALTLIGVVLGYFALENFLKITILERVYGMVIKQEKDMFLARAASLKDRLRELEALVAEYSKDDFDVSKEYDVLASVKAEKVDALAKDMTARSKALIDDNFTKVESAVGSLRERRRIADDNWPKWKEGIAKTLDDQGEVYISSLVTVPASLRAWALGRYVKEVGSEGFIFERDALKKRKVSPDQLVSDMIGKGLLRGAIVMKQDKVVLAEFAEGGGTVMTALSIKLSSYLRSLARNLGQHAPSSFVVIGDKTVVVMMKNRMLDSTLFINKDRFKDAIEQWKAKMKAFEGG